ncbi:MAG: phosphotransferase family protein, partial [Nitrospiria bacterium]
RCTFRLTLKRSPSNSTKPLTLYGKTFNHAQGRELHRLIRSIRMMSINTPGSFIIAQPLSYDEKLQTLWQTGLSGTSLRDVINHTNYKAFLESAAKGLACLHGLDSAHFLHQGTFDQLDDILEKIDTVIRELPQCARPLDAIVSEIKQDLPRLSKISDKTVHGSFRIKEILVCEEGLAVFDLDKVSIGDWVRDLALFLVDLHLIYRDKDLVRLMSSAFFHAYRSQVDWEVPIDRLKWHIKVQYLKKIYWIYKNKKLDTRLEKRIQKMITLIQNGIDFDPLSN